MPQLSEDTMTALPHTHFSIRLRRLPALVIAAAFALRLQRFVLVTRDAPHEPGCTDDVGVLVQDREVA